MDTAGTLQAVEHLLQPKRLNLIESLILQQSLQGISYDSIAQGCGYTGSYIREIGAQLWQEISTALGRKVTKKNLQFALQQCESQSGQEALTRLCKTLIVTQLPVHESQPTFVFPSGPVPLNSSLYIERPPSEALSLAHLRQPGCLIRIKAPRRMGKSSLLLRILAQAATHNYKVVYLDFQGADEAMFTSLDGLLRWFCLHIGRSLALTLKLEDYWEPAIGSKASCKFYLEAVFQQINCPLVLALNEVNRVFEYPKIAPDFLSMLRSWHEEARHNKLWQQCRLILCHSTEIYIQLKLNQSPFNVGVPIALPPFSVAQVQTLVQSYGLGWEDEYSASLLQALLGGHPYLTNLALYTLKNTDLTLTELLQTAPTAAGIYSAHLREQLLMLQIELDLVAALRQIVTAETATRVDSITAYKLESLGLIRLKGDRAEPSCELYRLYFREQLGKTSEVTLL